MDASSLEKLEVAFPDHVLGEEVEGEFVLLDLQGGGYYGLNEVGSRIWSLLQEGKTVKEVLEALLEEYDVSEERLKSDLVGFLTELQSRGLVEVHGMATT